MFNSIWSTPEVVSWSMGYDYSGYLARLELIKEATEYKAKPLSEENYKILTDALNKIYENDCKEVDDEIDLMC